MKKQWMRCLAAVSLITVMGTGNGWKTGGGDEAFTEKQLKGLSIVTGKQENDSDFPYDNLTYADKTQPKYQMINGGEKAEEPGAPKGPATPSADGIILMKTEKKQSGILINR